MTYVLSITISFFQIMENSGTKKTLKNFIFKSEDVYYDVKKNIQAQFLK